MPKRFRSLQPDQVVETVELLERRIAERFPDASLRQVAAELTTMAREAAERAQRISRPNIPLRVVQWLLVASGLALVTWFAWNVQPSDDFFKVSGFAQTMDGLISCLAAIGAVSLFVFSWELRFKRRQALNALHELRSMAHIVDMHQLTKDPEPLLLGGPSTPSSPERTLTPFELGRYLDYSSEMLSMISKTAAIYVQEFPDAVALDAVDEITSLTNGLTRNIWQKIMLLDRMQSTLETSSASASTPPLVAPTNAAAAPVSALAPQSG
ncbi:MAG: hypothetical protein IAG10_17260 [Planctomycetaceae bacterium]|nr:hypothetical protein [Planctomycetaceae bacterium]